jgi:hypothetical protein
MRDSLRTFCLRQLYQNPACSSKELVELAVQEDYLEPSTHDPQTKLLSALAGIPREERLNSDRFFPGGLGEFRAYDSLVTVLAQSRTLDTTLLRPLVGAVNLALHQDRRFYCLEDGSWYLQHQTVVNDQLFSALKEETAEVSLRQWLENFIAKNPGTVPVFWSLDPRFVLEGEHVRLNAQCTLLGQELDNLWPMWEAKFAHGAKVSTESLLQAFPQHDDCKPSILALEQVLALKEVSPIGNDLWMHEALIPKVPSVGGAVAFRVADVLKEEPLAFPSLMVLDSLGLGEVVLTAAHRIYGVLPISWNKVERLHYAKGLGSALGLKPEDNTFEVWYQDGFLYSEALAQRLSLLAPGQRLRLSVTEEELSFELRGFDARIAKAQSGLFSREELLLPPSVLSASLLAQVQAESEGINLSTLLANLDADYSLSEISLALTSPLLERGAGGFCRYKTLSFDSQEAILALHPTSSEVQPQESPAQPIPEEEEVPMAKGAFLLPEEKPSSEEEESLTALSPETQSLEAWSEFQESPEPYITLTEAELMELIQEQVLTSKNTAPPALQLSLDEPLNIPVETLVSEDEKKTFSPLSLEELFSLQAEEDFEDIPTVEDVQVLQEESEEDLAELIHSLYSDSPSPPIMGGEAALASPQLMDDHAPALMQPESAIPIEPVESIAVAAVEIQEPVELEVHPIAIDTPAVSALEEADEVLQMEPAIIEQFLGPDEHEVGLAEEKEEAAQPVISAELVTEAAEQVVEIQATETAELLEEIEEAGLPLSEPMVSSLSLEDLVLDLTGEKPEALTEPIAVITPLDSEPKERLDGRLEDLVFDLVGENSAAPIEPVAEVEAPILLEIHPIEIPAVSALVEELHKPTQEALEPASSLWIDELRMDLAEEEAPLQRPTEISSAATTASPEAIAFLHTLFEEEREAEEDEAEKEEKATSRPSASLQAKLDHLVAQREAILAQRQPAWTTLMHTVMAQTALSSQQQEEFQGVWMGQQTVLSPSLYALLEPSLCQLTVLSRLPLTGPLCLFVQALQEQVGLGEVDPTSVLESLILPVLQYQQTAEGWAQKSI